MKVSAHKEQDCSKEDGCDDGPFDGVGGLGKRSANLFSSRSTGARCREANDGEPVGTYRTIPPISVVGVVVAVAITVVTNLSFQDP